MARERAQKEGKEQDIYEVDVEDLERTAQAYRYLREQAIYSDWESVDCDDAVDGSTSTREEIHERVWEIVSPYGRAPKPVEILEQALLDVSASRGYDTDTTWMLIHKFIDEAVPSARQEVFLNEIQTLYEDRFIHTASVDPTFIVRLRESRDKRAVDVQS